MGGLAIVTYVIQAILFIFAALAGWTAFRAQGGKVYGKESPRTMMMMAGYTGAVVLAGLALAIPYIFASP